MKKQYFIQFTGLMLSVVLFFAACKTSCEEGSGNLATDTRKVAAFKKLDMSGAYKIVLSADTSGQISVTADDNVLKMIKTDVSGDRLRISTDKKGICTSNDIVIKIGVNQLEQLKAAGNINVTSEGKLVVKDLDIDLSGATNVELDLDAANVDTKADGFTEITLKGQATTHHVNMSGGGNIHAFDFTVGNYDLTLSGASKCDINVLNRLTVNSSGASSITYKGNPSEINNKKSGVSNIKKAE